MTSDRAVKGRKPRWRLSPREKYEVWIFDPYRAGHVAGSRRPARGRPPLDGGAHLRSRCRLPVSVAA